MLQIRGTALLLVLLLPAMAGAQSMNATISGTITDATRGVVPGAEVSLTNVARNVTVKTVSGADGLFSFPNLVPGSYDLKVAARGFKPVVQKGIGSICQPAAPSGRDIGGWNRRTNG